MPGGFVPFDGLAILSVTEPVPYLATNILNPSSFLASGTNVLAVQVFNYLIGSGDLQFNASLVAFPDTNAPVIVALEPPGGSVVRKLSALQMAFSEKVANVNASDLMINGSPATNLVALDRRSSASTPQRTVMIPQTGSRAALRRDSECIQSIALHRAGVACEWRDFHGAGRCHDRCTCERRGWFRSSRGVFQ